MSVVEKFIAQGFYFELLPVIILGICAGLANFFKRDDDTKTPTPTLRDLGWHTLSALVVCLICYGIMDSTNLSYLTKCSLSGAIAFFGFDKALDYARKLLDLRSSK